MISQENGVCRKTVLAGKWLIDTDPENTGASNGYISAPSQTAAETTSPAVIQETFPYYCGVAWYWKRFAFDKGTLGTDRLILRFEAVDYKADVWLNGTYLGSYEGGEAPFSFDITDALSDGGEDIISLRVVNPGAKDIDGLNITNIPCRNKNINLVSGCTINFGGLLGEVTLEQRPAAAITDLFAFGDIHTGEITLDVTLTGYAGNSGDAVLSVNVIDRGGIGNTVASHTREIAVPAGESHVSVKLTVPQPILWDIDEPYLYRINCTLTSSLGCSFSGLRHGFREFLVGSDGYFYLNGRRIFVKCAHSGNCMPVGLGYPKVKDHMRRDFVNAKTAGFNMVRVCAMMFRPEQLDFCDEIGLLVMDECYAAWKIAEGPYPHGDPELYLARFDNNTSAMVRTDRKHPSVVCYQLLNETGCTDVFRRAVSFLPRLREIDASRLVLLSSGRFDEDFSVGCTSNPFCGEWQHLLGADAALNNEDSAKMVGPSKLGSGDVHYYPDVPHTLTSYETFAALGRGTRPVFLSEYGVGTLFNVIHEMRMFEQYGADPKLCDYAWVKKQSDDFTADFYKYGLDAVFTDPEAALIESQRLGARQRNLGFNLIRANPKLNGFSLTGMLDHGMCGEGLWTYWRRWKPEMFDTVSDGFSPLRFCMYTYPTHTYAGRPFRLKVDLATEDALKPGRYPVTLKITNGLSVVKSMELEAVITDDMPLAVNLFDGDIVLGDVPSGKYTVHASLGRGGSPTGRELDFYVTNGHDIKTCGVSLRAWGLSGDACDFLRAHGVEVLGYTGETDLPVIVGSPAITEPDALFGKLTEFAMNGGRVCFLQSSFLSGHGALTDALPCGKVSVTKYIDHLYHKEVAILPHPVFDGVRKGMLDMDDFGTVFPHDVIHTDAAGAVNICSGFVTGYIFVGGSYESFYNAVLLPCGKGEIMLNTLYVAENISDNPVAGRILMNTAEYLGTEKTEIAMKSDAVGR